MAKPSKDKASSKRQEVIELAYNKAIKDDLTANEAASWATKQYGLKIAKGEVQYFATKSNKPYLDELIKGIRTIVT